MLLRKLLLPLVLLIPLLALGVPAQAATTTVKQITLASTCGTAKDSTAALNSALNQSNVTVSFQANACYNVSTVKISNTKGLTITGNTVRFVQTAAETSGAKTPILQLNNDKNLKFSHFVLVGEFNGKNGGAGHEGGYGIEFEGDNGIALDSAFVANIQGDFLYLSPPFDIDNVTDTLNTGITITNSVFANAGYHGITDESTGCLTLAPCNGLTINHDTFDNIATDAMDFEYDTYSTPFNTDGTPYWAAQDQVTIENSVWNTWGNDWYASIQGQKPGVQQQRITLSGNTLNGNGPLFEVVGTPTLLTSPRYLNAYMTVTNNFQNGYGAPYRGGLTPAMQIYSVAGLIMKGNTFRLCGGINCTAPNEYMMDLDNINYSVVEENNFVGAVGIRQPQSYNTEDTHLLICNNYFGSPKKVQIDHFGCQY